MLVSHETSDEMGCLLTLRAAPRSAGVALDHAGLQLASKSGSEAATGLPPVPTHLPTYPPTQPTRFLPALDVHVYTHTRTRTHTHTHTHTHSDECSAMRALPAGAGARARVPQPPDRPLQSPDPPLPGAPSQLDRNPRTRQPATLHPLPCTLHHAPCTYAALKTRLSRPDSQDQIPCFNVWVSHM